jgi:hypothetical protein
LLILQDIETILNTLIYDGKCERSIVASAGGSGDSGKVQLYRAINPLVETTGLMRMPKKIFIQSACYINIYKMCKISVIYT